MDKILLPSKYALKIFLKKYPTLKNKTSYHYYSLDIKFNNILKFSSRKGYLYASRKSFEKGFDVISKLDSKILKIDFIILLKNSLFRKKLLKYKALLIPSRADLFGFCALESLLEGVIPVVPKGLSYDELVDIPENLKLSSSINLNTVREIEKIIKQIESLSEDEYQKIILNARRSIVKIMNNNNHNFSSALKFVFYGKKK